jgi:hypothetical protein
MSDPRATASIPSASALDAFLLAPPHAPPACQVAQPLSRKPDPPAPCGAGRDGGSDPPGRSPATTPLVQRSGLAGCLQAAGERHAACGQKPMHQFGTARRWAGRRRRTRRPRLAPVGATPAGRWAWRQKPMHLNGPARWAADRPPTPLLRCTQRSRGWPDGACPRPAFTRGPAKALGCQPSPRGRDARQHPMHQKQKPGRPRSLSRPGCNETMVRLAPGRGPIDIHVDK